MTLPTITIAILDFVVVLAFWRGIIYSPTLEKMKKALRKRKERK